tara:strand:+ start:1642 stop:1863 length:222 start_codon:yes stop_codon:yes gene_type:complete
MSDLTKLTKAQLISVIEEQEENKWDNFKEEFGMTFTTDEEWIDFFKKIKDHAVDIAKQEWMAEMRRQALGKIM